jgi:carbonic anhydrase
MKKLSILAILLVFLTGLLAQAGSPTDDVLESLKRGNLRFSSGRSQVYDYREQLKSNIEGYRPETVVLACMDSRSIPEVTFNKDIGRMFNIRIAGNIINKDILGSIEYAVRVQGAKLILVLGHTDCGAAKGACENVKMGYLGQLVRKISPAVEQARTKNPQGQCSDHKFIDEIARLNVLNVINEIQKRSKIVAKLMRKGKVKIVGAIHDLRTGKVTFDINP